MSFVDGLLHRLRVLARGDAYDDELRDEMQFHVELEAQALSRQSSAPRDDARRAFGNQTYYREEARGMSALGWLDRVRQDLSYAWRGLRREPAFTAAVVVTLALGLGVNAAVYSVLDRIFVRAPAGVPDPGGVRRLYIEEGYAVTRAGSHVAGSFNYPTYRRIRAALPATLLAAYTPGDSVAVRTSGSAGSAQLSFATASYFRVLGIRPLIGRFFAPDEDRVAMPAPVVVISNALWDRFYHRSVDVLGKPLIIDGSTYTVIGVAPPEFTGIELDRADIWTPLGNFDAAPQMGRPWYESFGNYLRAVARPSTVESPLLDRASAAVRAQTSEFQGKPDTLSKVLMGPLIEARGPAEHAPETTISAKLAAVSLIVLFIACANVTNLLLIRATRRRREIAIRRALGVSGTRLVAQLMTESVLLALVAGTAALVIGGWGGLILRRLLFPRINWAGSALTLRLIAACAAAALLVGVAAGLAPGLGAARFEMLRGLRDGGQGRSRSSNAVRSGLLVAQAALSIVLLVGAGLFVRSLRNLNAIDIGYARDELLLVAPRFSSGIRNDTLVSGTVPSVAAELARAPGVRSVALTNVLPMRGERFEPVYVSRHDSAFHTGHDYPTLTAGSANYFTTAGVRILQGRGFQIADGRGAPPVVVVSQAFARAAWPGKSPIGKCLIVGQPENPCTTIVGVAADVHQMDIIEDETHYQYYLPLGQTPFALPTSILVRADPARFGVIARAARQEIGRALPTSDATYIRSLAASLEPQTRPWRLGAELFSTMGILAVIIAAIGIYSVVAYGVSQRAHEMGVRIALGARTSHIIELVVGGGLGMVAVGIVIGIVGALLLARGVQSLLYGVGTSDPTVLISASALLTILGAIACLIPAWRAARVDPVVTLRAE